MKKFETWIVLITFIVCATGEIVVFNYSPMVPSRGNTSIICTETSEKPIRSQLFIRRLFPWAGRRTSGASVQNVLNRTGLKYSWSRNPVKAVGPHVCGQGQNKVVTFKMNEIGSLRPKLFTQLVVSGERVVISMISARSSDTSSLTVIWRKDSTKLRMPANKIWPVGGGRGLVIKNVTKRDAGVYMAHRSNESGFFSAATIVIVRECSMTTWWHNCSRPCPVCKNGGICDEKTGKCRCPPGFTGQHCEKSCPHLHFGDGCSLSCTNITHDGSCRALQMCHVTGCQCMTGWTGPDCKTPCPPNYYGAGCTEQCLCKNGECDRFRGCICSPGWFGPHCKSDKATAGNAQKQNDEPARLRVVEKPPHIVGITAIPPSFKVNPRQRVEVQCLVTGVPLPIEGEILLKRGENNETVPNRTLMLENKTIAIFSLGIVSLYLGPYSCVSTTIAGSTRKAFNFTLSELPRPINAPVLIKQAATQLTIGLNSRTFRGDGPITRTIVQFKKVSDSTYNHYENSNVYNDTITISPLKEYTSYHFRVVLYREGGESGKGVPGPVATISTSCGKPTAPPVITKSYAINNSTLYMQWENPERETLKGDILGYKIFYYPLGLKRKYNMYQLQKPEDKPSFTIRHLTPHEVYGVRVKVYNCAGDSDLSREARVTMGRLPKPKGPRVTYSNLTSSSVSVSWFTPSNSKIYTILFYEISFTEVGNDSPNAMRMHKNTSQMSRDFNELVPHTSYSFHVRAFNHEGAGNFSDVIVIMTLEDVPSKPLKVRASQVTSSGIFLKWNSPQNPNGVLRSYEIEMKQEEGDWMKLNSQHPGNITSINIVSLLTYTVYQFRIRGFTIEAGDWSDVTSVRTMSDRPLLPPQNIEVDVINSQSVAVRWAPPPHSDHVGNVTSYKVIYTDDLRQTSEHWRTKITNGEKLSVLIESLRVDTVYAFKIAAKTQILGPYSTQITRRTDKLGLPPPPDQAKVVNVTSSSAIVTWTVSKSFRITYVKIRFLSSGGSPLPSTVLVETERPDWELNGLNPSTHYEIELMAGNYVGFSSLNPVLRFTTKASEILDASNTNNVVPTGQTWVFKIVLAVLGGVICVIIIMFIVIYCRCRKGAQQACPSHVEMDSVSTNNRHSTFGSSSQGGGINSRSGTMLSVNSKHSTNSRAPSTYSGQIFPESLILPWENILFEDIPLGVGNFGQVVKAIVQKDGKIIQTAVKMLKDGSTLDDKRDFLAELDTMVRIGHHKNVVSLVGACEHDNAMYLCTEFAPNGNLLQFLRKSRKADDLDGSYTTLSQTQLLQFAFDVSQGMSYLSEKQLIHRDLAARNILLGDHLICKVADFGLSRGEGVYVKKTVSRLPIRWMAIESLNYNVYTSKSDVWSFGVLLWEIVSLGGTPYCGMSCAELYEKLPTGFRMDKPINCDDEVYALMYQCWKDRPYDRPTFSQLCIALERMCDARSSRNYVNTAIFEDFKFANIDVNEEEG